MNGKYQRHPKGKRQKKSQHIGLSADSADIPVSASQPAATSQTFEALVQSIQKAHAQFASLASRAVNVSLTLRNWMIGMHIVEFQLHGKDRARYGNRLLEVLSKELGEKKVLAIGRRQLYQYVSFYRIYPTIVDSPNPLLADGIIAKKRQMKIVRTVSAQSRIEHDVLLNRLSYSHFELLIGIDDDLKRSFYESECIAGG